METQKQLETPDEPERLETPDEPEAKAADADSERSDSSEADGPDQPSFDENLDSGDPYNSTGSHVILELRKYAGE